MRHLIIYARKVIKKEPPGHFLSVHRPRQVSALGSKLKSPLFRAPPGSMRRVGCKSNGVLGPAGAASAASVIMAQQPRSPALISMPAEPWTARPRVGAVIPRLPQPCAAVLEEQRVVGCKSTVPLGTPRGSKQGAGLNPCLPPCCSYISSSNYFKFRWPFTVSMFHQTDHVRYLLSLEMC